MGKKQRKKNRPPGQDPQEIRRQRLEARRQAKAEQEAARAKRRRRETLIRFITIGLLASLVFWFIFLRDRAPTEINGHQIETLSVRGVGEHTREPVQYETSPAVSGAHAFGAAACGTYAQPIEDPIQVHMLEHGAVGVQYRPDALELEDIKRIEALVNEWDSFTFSAPYLDMETPVAVTSWARIMRLDSVDEDAIRQYIERFRDRGPEADQPCPNDSEQEFQPPGESEGEEGAPVPGDDGEAEAEEPEDETTP